jgi:hypothetical protein
MVQLKEMEEPQFPFKNIMNEYIYNPKKFKQLQPKIDEWSKNWDIWYNNQ